ncbi:MAG: AsmA family protein [Prevotella sp.]|nr:AsmA family protein [Prevotella sp.]
MNKKFSILLKVLGGIVAAILLLLLVAAVLLNTHAVQNKLLGIATERLEEKLQTRVIIDDVSVNVFAQRVNLKGLEVEDRQQQKMLVLDRLSVSVELAELLANKLVISKVDIEGVKARLNKPDDGPANYQFIIDAFKRDKPKKEETKQQEPEKKKEPFNWDVNHLKLAKIDVQYNGNKVSLDEVTFDKGWLSKATGKLQGLQGQWELQTKKGPQTAKFSLGTVHYDEKKGQHDVKIGGLHLALDNHQPRKNANKPKRGFFDVGHLDVIADLQLTLNHIAKDSVNATLTKFVARDSVTGFNVKDLRFTVGATKQQARLSNIVVQQENTVLQFDSASLVLPSKKEGRKFSFQTSLIKGKTLLKDISRPFAPVLKDFKMPLELSVLFSGTDTTLVFKDIEVHTPDQRLKINAVGGIDQLNKKEEMDIHFHVSKMTAKGSVKQEIINQFQVKKMMIKQLEALGDITYTGDIRIPWHKECFKGVLGTAVGSLNFDFTLNEDTKHVSGNAQTKSIQLGKVLKMKDIGNVGAKANFDIDIHKGRTAQMRKQHGGKLPIGKVNATVYEASYKKIKVKNLLVDMKSNGGQLEGNISQTNKGLDWACDFTMTDIDKPSSLKVKPKVKVKFKDLFKKKK